MVDLTKTQPAITLAEAKLWLRVDFDDDDLILTSLILSSTQLVETRIRRAIVSRGEERGVVDRVADVPASIKVAVLTLVAYQYENRTATDDEIRSRVMRSVGLDGFIDWSG